MREVKVIDTLRIGNNTSIGIQDRCIELKNGSIVFDNEDKPFKVLSIALTNTKGSLENTILLVEGIFNSQYMKI